ncbi:clathrin adaptor, mu subunit [Violaceomyces palustris]|uniref:Clathrin adaptor, mu subunit n=1 Tax=Violaceomyces palustris TaxID=1673888 RepID=A0ACD0P3C3_9BASI|nr:clathrin adaptor, mu subunit [Violaceomyces palustris]
MGKIDGIIILAADGRPIVHSHFQHPLPSYPLLHTDHFNNLLQSIHSSNVDLSRGEAGASLFGSDLDTLKDAKDIKPVLWVAGIPNGRASYGGEDDEEEEEEDEEGEDDDDDDDDESEQEGDDPTPGVQATPFASSGESNVWSQGVSHQDVASPPSPPSNPNLGVARGRGDKVISQAEQALAEQGAALCHIQSGNLRFLCPISSEVDPLLPLCFLRSFVSILQEYLAQSSDPNALTEDLIRDHFDIVYQLFEEILDKDGNILTTEVNFLKDLVMPPSWVDKIVKAVGVAGLASSSNPPPMMSPIPWRRPNTKYGNNELYIDMVESLEGIVEANGRPLVLDLWAKLECNARLSGNPDISISFNNPKLIEDVSFHPCVRHRRWSKEKLLSFIPPDGNFELACFRIGPPHSIPITSSPDQKTGMLVTSACNGWSKSVPIFVHSEFEMGGAPRRSTKSNPTLPHHRRGTSQPSNPTFSIQVQSQLPPDKVVENVVITFSLGPGSHSVEASTSFGEVIWNGGVGSRSGGGGGASVASQQTVQSSEVTSFGSFVWDQNSKVMKWSLEKLCSKDRPIVLKGSWKNEGEKNPNPSTAVTSRFSVPIHSLSGLKVSSLQIVGEGYKPFKGVRSMLVGEIDWRV